MPRVPWQGLASLPQGLGTSDAPTFAGLTVNGTATFASTVTVATSLTVPSILAGAPAALAVALSIAGGASRAGTDTNTAGANVTVKAGLGTGTGAASSIIFQTPTLAASGTDAQTLATRFTVGTTTVTSAVPFTLNVGGAVILTTAAAHVLEQRDGANAQESRVYNTWTNATNYEAFTIRWAGNECYLGVEKGAGGGTARKLNFYTDGVTRWSIGATTGHFLAGADNTHDIGAAGATRPRTVYLGTKIVSPAYHDTNDVKVVGTQGATVADATDAGSAITQLNALLARVRAHGLIAT